MAGVVWLLAAKVAIPNGSDDELLVGGVLLNGLLKGLLLFSIANGMGEVFFMLNSCPLGGNAGGGNVGEATKIAGAVDGAEERTDLDASSALGSKSSSLNPSWNKKWI